MVCSTILATTLSTSIVSLSTSLVLSSARAPAVTVHPITEQSPLSHDKFPPITDMEQPSLPQDMNNMDSSITDILANIDAGNTVESVDRVTQPGNKSTQTSTEPVEQTQPRHYLNNFLPPLLALVSLKDSFIDFVNAVRDKNGNNLQRNENLRSDLDEICSDGPCQQETWPGCWNTSDNLDMSHDYFRSQCFSSYFRNNMPMESDQTIRPGKGCQNCGARMKKLHPFERCPRGFASRKILCCCSVRGQHSVTDRIDWFHPVFSDLFSLGFMTHPGNPLVVTT